MDTSASKATYKVIALDLAKKIVNGEYPVGTKISGRSLLSSQYDVSPETIRRAISLLKAENIVDVSRGKEIVVTSPDHCSLFLEQQQSKSSTVSLYQKLDKTFKKKQAIDQELKNTLDDVITYLNYVKYSDLLNPVDITISPDSHIIGKSIKELDFWQHTQATIVAVIQNSIPVKSPSPDLVLKAGDSLVVIGPGNLAETVSNFINHPQQKKRHYLRKAFSLSGALLLLTEESAALTMMDLGELIGSSYRLTTTLLS